MKVNLYLLKENLLQIAELPHMSMQYCGQIQVKTKKCKLLKALNFMSKIFFIIQVKKNYSKHISFFSLEINYLSYWKKNITILLKNIFLNCYFSSFVLYSDKQRHLFLHLFAEFFLAYKIW